MILQPRQTRIDKGRIEEVPLQAHDGTRLELCRIIVPDREPKGAVLLLHGLTSSSDCFVLPETRNLVDVLLDEGYEPWLLDWRGSCRLPYNESGPRYSVDDVALYDLPAAVETIRAHLGGKKLFVLAHCFGAISLGMSLSAGLVTGLDGVVAQGAFLTPTMATGPRLRMGLLGDLLRPLIGEKLPIDFRKVGLFSRHTPVFLAAGIGASCSDPTCQILHSSAWGTGASLYVHDNLHPITHDRLTDLLGAAPTWILSHLRKMVLARAVVTWNDNDERYRALPVNAVDEAGRIDCPILLVSGQQNGLWPGANRVCNDLLRSRHPALNVEYVEVPGYGHFDAIIGRNAAIDVFPYMTRWLNGRAASRHQAEAARAGGIRALADGQ